MTLVDRRSSSDHATRNVLQLIVAQDAHFAQTQEIASQRVAKLCPRHNRRLSVDVETHVGTLKIDIRYLCQQKHLFSKHIKCHNWHFALT